MLSLEDVKKYLENDDWNYKIVSDPDDSFIQIQTGIQGKNEAFTINIIIDSERNYILFRIDSIAKLANLTIAKKDKLHDLINEHNANKAFGKFYVDSDNELAFLYAIPIDDSVLGCESFYRCLYTSANSADDIFPNVMKLIWS